MYKDRYFTIYIYIFELIKFSYDFCDWHCKEDDKSKENKINPERDERDVTGTETIKTITREDWFTDPLICTVFKIDHHF